MNFATWSIRNPTPAVLLFVLLTLAGFAGFKALPIQNFPDISLPAVTVNLSMPGAAPAQLETEMARKVEDALARISDLKHMNTSITNGTVSIVAEFELEKKISEALAESKDAVDSIRSTLPPDMLQPVVTAMRVVPDVLATYAISASNMDEEALSWLVDNTVSKAMLAVKGVGSFERIGGVTREVQVTVDPVKMSSLDVTVSDISRALKQAQMESSGGQTQIGTLDQSVRTIATVKQARDLALLPIALTDGRRISLDQVATVQDTFAQRTQQALLDGAPAVGFRMYRARGSDETRVLDVVIEALNEIQQQYPELAITRINSSVDYTLEQFHASMHMLYEGAILAVIVVWFFLRDWRATFISAVALPLSIIPTFAFMHWVGFALNTLSLLALAVVVGILVDDAIVEVENIVRHKRMGKSSLKAAEDGVTEIALAVMATTFALVVVFTPTSLMGGVSGLVFRQFGWTVVISVLVSLLVARLITPVMAAYLLSEKHEPPAEDGPVMRGYLRLAQWCLEHRKTTLVSALTFFITAIGLITLLPKGFIPAADRGFSTVTIELPPGSPLESTVATAERARLAIADIEEIEHIFTAVGDTAQGGAVGQEVKQVRKGKLILAYVPRNERRSQNEIEHEVRQRLMQVPGARFTLSSGGPGEKAQIMLASDNTPALLATAKALTSELRTIPELSNIVSTASLDQPELIVRPDTERATELGVNSQTIGDIVRIATAGDFDAQLSKLNLDNRQIYIRVQLPESSRQRLDIISSLRIPTKNGTTTLDSVADVYMGTGPSQIDRYDRQRFVSISADLGGAPLGPALEQANELPAIVNMPSSVKQINSGDGEIMEELFTEFGRVMSIGILCVYCILVLLFKNFTQPVTILSALPLSIGGAVIALLVTNELLGLSALIGIVMLMGIVTKNSILLVEYCIISMRDNGLELYDALLDACHKRARPIVMTTLAMIAGMIPVALGVGGDSAFRQPMAISVIGGLITSTALSLLVVPVVFIYVQRIENLIKQLIDKFTTEGSPEKENAVN